MKGYVERMIIEKNELNTKWEKLRDFLGSEIQYNGRISLCA